VGRYKDLQDQDGSINCKVKDFSPGFIKQSAPCFFTLACTICCSVSCFVSFRVDQLYSHKHNQPDYKILFEEAEPSSPRLSKK
jgi:hypothetical protein